MIKKPKPNTIRVALGATFLFATMLMAIPSRALDCKNLNVIFMRGSSQNYIPHNNEDVNFPDWIINTKNELEFNDYRINKNDDTEPAFVTKEKESLKYFKSIGDRVHKDFPTLTMQFVSLHDITGRYNQNGYDAVSAFGPWTQGFVSKNAIDAKLAPIDGGDYNRSVIDGAQELAGYLEDQMISCPSQYNVVGGFSQGAHVVGEAMKLLHDQGKDNLLSRLGHVDMYGDPKFNGFDLATSRINPLQKHVTMPWTRGDGSQFHSGSLGARKPYVPDILTSKTTSWCGQLDIVCGGIGALNIFESGSHGKIYNEDGGFIEKSANEIYVDLKTRLALLAGLTDTSANSPLAFWNGIKNPKKIDIMFVMDRTGDESLSLSPEADYLARNFTYLANSGLSSIFAGVVTYTEFSRFNGTKDVVESFPKTVTNLTSDIYGDFSAFKSTWGPAHSQNPPSGGADLQDSPFSAINMALDQKFWRPEARKVIVLFSNTWGKESEDSTTFTMKSITSKARTKDVEILPVFTSKTFRANPGRVDLIPTANAYWNRMAKATSGHYTEVSDLISEKLVYDVIMGHVHAPDVEITTSKALNKPSTTTKKVAQSTTIKNTKPVLKKGKKVTLSATKSNTPKSKVKTYAWDLNGDGVVDETGTLPDITFTPDLPFDGSVTVTITGEDGSSTTGSQDIQITDDDSLVTHEDPAEIITPNIQATRDGLDIILTWNPAEGDLVFEDDQGAIIANVDASLGMYIIHDVPQTAFTMLAQLTNGAGIGDALTIVVVEAPKTVKDPTPTADTTNTPSQAVLTPSENNQQGSQQQTQNPQDTPPPSNSTQQDEHSTIPKIESPATNPQTQNNSTNISNNTELKVNNPTTKPNIYVDTSAPQVLGLATTAIQNPTLNINTPLQSVIQGQNIKLPTLKTKIVNGIASVRLGKVKISYDPTGMLNSIKFLFWIVFYIVWPNLTILLVLLLLLLIILDISLRDRRKQQYKHDQQYAYKTLLHSTYKV